VLESGLIRAEVVDIKEIDMTKTFNFRGYDFENSFGMGEKSQGVEVIAFADTSKKESLCTGLYDLPMIGDARVYVHDMLESKNGTADVRLRIGAWFLIRRNESLLRLVINVDDWILDYGDDDDACTPEEEMRRAIEEDESIAHYNEMCLRSFMIVISQESMQKFEKYLSDTPQEKPLGTTERDTLLKQIGVLSMALAGKSSLYRRGDAPNVKQISEAALAEADAMQDANKRGLSLPNLMKNISDGIALLGK
jgi:hypothetical protein